jgi:hypothetical protein
MPLPGFIPPCLPTKTKEPPRGGGTPAYRTGPSPDWLKMKNPACEAARREAEEDWR